MKMTINCINGLDKKIKSFEKSCFTTLDCFIVEVNYEYIN